MVFRRLTSQFFKFFQNRNKISEDLVKSRQKMEITRHNFAEKLPLIEEAIENASFIAIDGEFTGMIFQLTTMKITYKIKNSK